jgi:flagellar biosynthesis regulator FlbT
MTGLVLTIPADGTLRINGAELTFPRRSTVHVAPGARFLTGKQWVPPEECARSPARRVYGALQARYLDPAATYDMKGNDIALTLIDAMEDGKVRGAAMTACLAFDPFEALKAAGRAVVLEDSLAGLPDTWRGLR